jgi:catecholate siderophore receptor
VGSPGALVAALGGALLAPASALAQADAANSSGVIELGPLRVEDRDAASALGHDTGLAALPGSVQDTPQAITVIPQEQLKEQGVTSLEQALRNVPGITIAIGEGGTLNGDQFKIRGFDAKDDVYVDGLRDFGVYTRDSFAFQEVQVLKGPSGTMFGRGTTGGVINTVSKTPFLGNLSSVDFYAGNGDYYRALADINYALDDTTAVRLNLMGNANHVVDRDLIKSERWGAAGAIAFGLGTGTRFILNYLHQDDDRVPDYGITIVQPPRSIIARPASEYGVPRSNMLGYSTDRDRTHADVATERLSHRATPWLTLTSDSRAGFYSRYFQYTTVDRCDATAATNFCASKLFGANPTTAEGGIGGGGPYFQRAWGLQNISTARADFDIANFRTEAIAGIDASYQDNQRTFYYYTLPAASQFTYTIGNGTASRSNIGRNLFNPNHQTPPNYAPILPTPGNIGGTSATSTSAARNTGNSSDFGFFLTDRIWFDESWSAIGGIRYDRFNSEFNTTTVAGALTALKSQSHLVNPRASVVYEPDTTKTFYFSYGRSATPQGASAVGAATAIAVSTKDLEPELSETFELGAKYGFFGGRLGITGSIFDVKKDNATQSDPATGFVVAQSGEKQEVKGLELGATGKITPGWTINASYAYLDTHITESFTACSALTATSLTGAACPSGVAVGTPVLNLAVIDRQILFVPKNAASLWTSYDAAELAPGLSFGGGVTYQSTLPVTYQILSPVGSPTLVRLAQVPETISLDAFIAYRFDKYRFSVNAYNLTDRLNYTQVFGNRATPAPGRTVIFSLGMSL